MAGSQAERFRADLLSWAEDNLRAFPWRDPDASTYEVFVAELLLTRTRASMVEGVYGEFLATYPSFVALSEADHPTLANVIEPLGLHNRRASALLETARIVEGGGLPADEGGLLALPHVGRYVANATLCFGFKQRRAIVDANVHRVYSRVFGGDRFDGPDDDALWEFAEHVLPESYEAARRYNLALLDFGAEVCAPRTPNCEACFAPKYCRYYADAFG